MVAKGRMHFKKSMANNLRSSREVKQESEVLLGFSEDRWRWERWEPGQIGENDKARWW